MQQYAQASGIN